MSLSRLLFNNESNFHLLRLRTIIYLIKNKSQNKSFQSLFNFSKSENESCFITNNIKNFTDLIYDTANINSHDRGLFPLHFYALSQIFKRKIVQLYISGEPKKFKYEIFDYSEIVNDNDFILIGIRKFVRNYGTAVGLKSELIKYKTA